MPVMFESLLSRRNGVVEEEAEEGLLKSLEMLGGP